MKSSIVLFALLCFGLNVKAQFAETIRTGRPGQAVGPFAVGKSIYQVQAGFDYLSATTVDNNYEGETSLFAQNAVFRIGLKEDFELRIGYNYNLQDKFEQNNSDFTIKNEGVSDLNFGFRQYLFDQKGLLPSFGIQFTAHAGGFDEYEMENFNSELKLIANHNISEKFALNTNLAFNWQTDRRETVVPFVVNLGIQLTDDLSAVVETYGNIEKYDNSIFFGAGLGYLLSPDFQLDIYTSYGDNQDGEFGSTTETIYTSAGISYRLNRRN